MNGVKSVDFTPRADRRLCPEETRETEREWRDILGEEIWKIYLSCEITKLASIFFFNISVLRISSCDVDGLY